MENEKSFEKDTHNYGSRRTSRIVEKRSCHCS